MRCGRRNSGGRDRRRGDGRRPHRVGELIRREISGIIDDAFALSHSNEDKSNPVLISVVDVKCSDDLRNARVSVSVLGSDEEKETAISWLRNARKEIRYELAQCVQLKYIPELLFTESELAQAVKTVDILNRLAREREQKQSLRSPQGASVGAGDFDPDMGFISSSNDALILDDLDTDGLIDIDDDASDALIVEVPGGDEELESMSDERFRKELFNTLGEEDFVK